MCEIFAAVTFQQILSSARLFGRAVCAIREKVLLDCEENAPARYKMDLNIDTPSSSLC